MTADRQPHPIIASTLVRRTRTAAAVEVCIIREFPWVPSESNGNGKHRLNSWVWEREWEWWIGNGREMGIVVWKKFPLVALMTFCPLAR